MITIKNLWKKFSNNVVLRGLDLHVKEGEILVISGRSGVGKSVLLKHIIGLEKPDMGSVEINGINITELKPPKIYEITKNMGMLFQGAALFDSMDIATNTGFYLTENKDTITNKKLSQEQIQKRVLEALKMVGLEGQENKMPSSLSGGMKKRAALARLIAYRPKILLYDEPTTGLDPITANQINDLIIKIQNELNGTSIIVTHDTQSALYVADRLALHQDGKIVHIDTPQRFMEINDPVINFLRESIKNPMRYKEK